MVLFSALGVSSPALAQEPDEPAEPVLAPPRVVSIPEVVLSEGSEVPEGGVVSLELLVRADGRAEVTACDGGEALCARVREAIAGGAFEAATRDGVAIDARIAMRFRVRRAEPVEDAPPAEPTEERVAEARPPRPVVVEDREGFGVVARVERPPPGALRLELEEMRDMPGAFGDPFRAIESLPGVTPILSGLPYFYVRGSPPSGTIYVYDDITLPALYHLGLGPAVVHPRMIGPLRLYSGVPPARFGRLIGGVIEAEGPPAPEEDRLEGEIELRLLDVTAFVQTPVGEGGRLAVAGRYGYPGLLLSIFSPQVTLAYWDYQLRLEHPIGRRDRIEVIALGSFDSFTATEETDGPDDMPDETSLLLQFHRLEARLVRSLDYFEIGTALRLGWEESGLDDELALRAFTVGPRFWVEHAKGALRVRVGAEMIGSAGDLIFTPGRDEGPPEPDEPSRGATSASVASRNQTTIYGEVAFDPIDAVTLDLGLRGDVWVTGQSVDAALDPRLRATWHAMSDLDVHLAFGVARQPAVFFIPLPGLAEVALDFGLQTATQGELGITAKPVEGIDLEAQIFVHRYTNLRFPDLFNADQRLCVDDDGACIEIEAEERVDGTSYGAEVFIRRDITHRLAGFLSYTLAWAELEALPDIEYQPSYDVRHVANLATRWDMGGGFSAGVRLHFRTGKPVGVYYLNAEEGVIGRYHQRLPPFFRADALIAYAWKTSWGRFRLALEWLNLGFSREPVGADCQEPRLAAPTEACPVEYLPAIVAPNLGLRAVF